VVQYETGLVGPIRNWAWWANTEFGLVGQAKLGLVSQYGIGLGGPGKAGLRI